MMDAPGSSPQSSEKFPQEAAPRVAALFRMELHGEDILFFSRRRGEWRSVRASCGRRSIRIEDCVGVGEVEVRACVDAFEQT